MATFIFILFFCMRCRGSCQRHEICGRERDGAGYTVNQMTLQGFPGPCTTGTFRKEIREFEGGGFGVD